MNKIILSLATIAALSTASFASQRNSEAPELLDRAWTVAAPAGAKALIVIKAGKTNGNFEALNTQMMINETNQH
jgi:hypothetical protein